jgi:hypothetical protein
MEKCHFDADYACHRQHCQEGAVETWIIVFHKALELRPH